MNRRKLNLMFKNKVNSEIYKAILVAVSTKEQSVIKTGEYLDELSELCRTIEIKPLEKILQNLDHPKVNTYVGKGKLEEIKTLIDIHGANIVIFDDDLSASQVRNLEKALKCKILDRSLLILDIFAMRAKTSQAKIQIELAQYEYLLPRLTRMWSHLSKQKGGSPGMRGPGEKELETDKRIVKDKISLLKKRLFLIEKQGEIQRKKRNMQVRVSLVGYTNAGKSTLMRLLSKSEVLTEDKLFATIGSTVRKVVFKNVPFLLADTVGFIRKLPHTLIECFKSTLEEVRESDILIHVIDFSHNSFKDHIDVVNATLKEIGVKDIPIILVFNKVDKMKERISDLNIDQIIPFKEENGCLPPFSVENKTFYSELKEEYTRKFNCSVVFISAIENINIEELKNIIYKKVKRKYMQIYPNYLIDSHF